MRIRRGALLRVSRVFLFLYLHSDFVFLGRITLIQLSEFQIRMIRPDHWELRHRVLPQIPVYQQVMQIR